MEGVLRAATNYAYELQTADGNIHSFSANELKHIAYHEGPSMPRDYTKRLTAAEIDDILAFLARQTVRQRATD
jgi:hypothetical protein